MTETSGIQPGEEGGDENVGTSDTLDQATSHADEANPAAGTERIEGGGVPGQDQTPAASDDVGVPEELEDRTE